MERSFSSSSSSNNSSFSASKRGSSATVLSIQCLKGSSKADEWTGDALQTGDIVEELRIGNMIVKAPFKNGRAGLQKLLHDSFKLKNTSVHVRVRRGADDDGEFAELQACLVPNAAAGRKQYMLRSIDDPNYAVGFADRTESECLDLQELPFNMGSCQYPWQRKMAEMLPVPNSSSFYSILLLPKTSGDNEAAALQYNDLEDTLGRANAWLNASQASGVPIVFMNIQTESLLTKISGRMASCSVNAGSLSDLSNLNNASLYGFEDYHGVDIGVVRAVRTLGFIYISTVMGADENSQNTPSEEIWSEAPVHGSNEQNKLLVVSRISTRKCSHGWFSPAAA
nr:TRNA-2-methylthio-N(6)-dimethylallyladenosine synthase [Ipomoea batatas]